MRPNIDRSGKEIYECPGCGSREASPDTRHCSNCGGELRNLGVPRDL